MSTTGFHKIFSVLAFLMLFCAFLFAMGCTEDDEDSRCVKYVDGHCCEAMLGDQCIYTGNVITFGKYPQASEELEPLQWRVYGIFNFEEEHRVEVWLLSEYIIDSKPYSTSANGYLWKDSTLRAWLNHEFLETAFSSDEQAMIKTSHVGDRDVKEEYYTNDKVYLLSSSQYSEGVPVGLATTHAIQAGLSVSSENCANLQCPGNWWLYSSDDTNVYVPYRKTSHKMDQTFSNMDGIGVRPTMWIQFSTAK